MGELKVRQVIEAFLKNQLETTDLGQKVLRGEHFNASGRDYASILGQNVFDEWNRENNGKSGREEYERFDSVCKIYENRYLAEWRTKENEKGHSNETRDEAEIAHENSELVEQYMELMGLDNHADALLDLVDGVELKGSAHLNRLLKESIVFIDHLQEQMEKINLQELEREWFKANNDPMYGSNLRERKIFLALADNRIKQMQSGRDMHEPEREKFVYSLKENESFAVPGMYDLESGASFVIMENEKTGNVNVVALDGHMMHEDIIAVRKEKENCLVFLNSKDGKEIHRTFSIYASPSKEDAKESEKEKEKSKPHEGESGSSDGGDDSESSSGNKKGKGKEKEQEAKNAKPDSTGGSAGGSGSRSSGGKPAAQEEERERTPADWSFDELVFHLKECNPDVVIIMEEETNDMRRHIYASVPLAQLKLPEGFHVNTKYGICSNDRGMNTQYCSCFCKPLIDPATNEPDTHARDITLQRLGDITVKFTKLMQDNPEVWKDVPEETKETLNEKIALGVDIYDAIKKDSKKMLDIGIMNAVDDIEFFYDNTEKFVNKELSKKAEEQEREAAENAPTPEQQGHQWGFIGKMFGMDNLQRASELFQKEGMWSKAAWKEGAFGAIKAASLIGSIATLGAGAAGIAISSSAATAVNAVRMTNTAIRSMDAITTVSGVMREDGTIPEKLRKSWPQILRLMMTGASLIYSFGANESGFGVPPHTPEAQGLLDNTGAMINNGVIEDGIDVVSGETELMTDAAFKALQKTPEYMKWWDQNIGSLGGAPVHDTIRAAGIDPTALIKAINPAARGSMKGLYEYMQSPAFNSLQEDTFGKFAAFYGVSKDEVIAKAEVFFNKGIGLSDNVARAAAGAVDKVQGFFVPQGAMNVGSIPIKDGSSVGIWMDKAGKFFSDRWSDLYNGKTPEELLAAGANPTTLAAAKRLAEKALNLGRDM